MRVTLSFDNGPDPDVTPHVLAVLARRDVKTTFFVIGQKLTDPAQHEVCARAYAQGHWIGNHTFTHSVPFGRRREPDVAEAEIGRTQALLGALAHPDRWFRPFGGGGNLDQCLLNGSAVEFLQRGRYTCVLWNAVPRDWEDPDGWVDRALAHCRSQPWTLLVLHDLPTGAMRHLDRFLATLQDLGAEFRQEFPPDCVPIVRGEIVLPLARYVSGAQDRC
jgi:peptidoglycan/xylan/chitin deacetylase (PgdA/CDA1 family)